MSLHNEIDPSAARWLRGLMAGREGGAMKREEARASGEPRRWRFRIPIDIGPLSPNRRMHHMARARLVKRARAAARIVWMAAGRPKADRRVILDVEVFRGRQLDDDGAITALKALRDGICNNALTPNDSPVWVRQGAVVQRTGRCFAARPEVVVTAREDDDD